MKDVGYVTLKKECLPKWDEFDLERLDKCEEYTNKKFKIDRNWNYELVFEYVNQWSEILLNILPSEQMEEYAEYVEMYSIGKIEHTFCKMFNVIPKKLDKLAYETERAFSIMKILVRANKYWNKEGHTKNLI